MALPGTCLQWLQRAALIAALLCAWLPAARGDAPVTQANRHALMIVAGQYANGLPSLPGTARDAEHARAVAAALGIPEQHITWLRERQASADAIRRAASELALRLAAGDQVLLLFSGLGGQRPDLDRPGVCEETFIAADGVPLGHGELASYFVPVAERAEKTVAFFDTCSGRGAQRAGLAQRCVPAAPGSSCASGARWREFVTELRKSSVPTANVLALMAAAPGQPAYGDARNGGLFGSALPACLDAGRNDSNRSGALSFGEVKECVDGQLRKNMQETASMRGNPDFAPLSSGLAGSGIEALFDDVHAGRDGRRELVLRAEQRPGGGRQAGLSLRSSSVGYVYLFATQAGGGYRLLFPNAEERDNRLRAGSTFSWAAGDAAAALTKGAKVLALVADNERDPALLPGGANSGAFAGDAAGRAALLRFAATSLRSQSAPCREVGSARNLSLARACSNAYGAALLDIDTD